LLIHVGQIMAKLLNMLEIKPIHPYLVFTFVAPSIPVVSKLSKKLKVYPLF